MPHSAWSQEDLMITLTQAQAGVIELNFVEEPRFEVASHGLDVTFGLQVKSFRRHSILIDDGGDPGRILSYLLESLTNSGFDAVMETALGKT